MIIIKLDFKRNLGPVDRMIRAILGIGVITLGYYLMGWMRIVSIILGVLLLLSSIIGYCMIYSIFGISTRN